MTSASANTPSFLQALTITKGDMVCITGAGGKTTLLFTLAQEAKSIGLRTLVTTTTKILIPRADQYDRLDLNGLLPGDVQPGEIIVAGTPTTIPGKITSLTTSRLQEALSLFDLVLIEADGAAMKRLKGWKETEPVIPKGTSVTVGVIDMQTIGCSIDEMLVHRLDRFLQLTGAQPGEPVTTSHLVRLITDTHGLFQYAQGKKIVYCNKIESIADRKHFTAICNQLPQVPCVGGSLLKKRIELRSR